MKRFPLFFILSLILLSGCDRREPVQTETTPRRIITLAPSITEMAFALGLGDRIVGVSDYARYPREALAKKRVGGLLNPNMEVISALRPDMILATTSFRRAGDNFRKLGLPVHYLPEKTISDLFAAIDSTGRLCAVPGRADSLKKLISDSLQRYRHHPDNPPAVMLVLGRAAGRPARIGVSGPGAFIDELLQWCGGKNVFADLGAGYSQINREDILKRDPDIIIEFTGDTSATTRQRLLREWALEPRLRAVKNGRVHIISGNAFMIPGPRVHVLAGELFRILSGESKSVAEKVSARKRDYR